MTDTWIYVKLIIFSRTYWYIYINMSWWMSFGKFKYKVFDALNTKHTIKTCVVNNFLKKIKKMN